MPYAIGIDRSKTECNVGTLLRSAHAFDASLVFTVGRRYKHQASDTTHAARHVPLLHFLTWAEAWEHLPLGWSSVAVEIAAGAVPLATFDHPRSAVYILGPEDGSLGSVVLERCRHIVQIPSAMCLNVATAGSIVMYDRAAKRDPVSIGGARPMNIKTSKAA